MRPPKGAGRAWPSCDIFDDSGIKIGEIKFGISNNTLSAHCLFADPSTGEHPHGLCRLDRTCNGSVRFPNGRPLGYLIAWLRRGCMYSTRAEHFAGARGLIPYGERLFARNWAMGQPGLQFFLDCERTLMDGESIEPLEAPN